MPPVQRWPLLTRVAFRFSFVYLGLYALATQIFGGLLLVPGFSFPALGRVWPMRLITEWYATRVFGLTDPLAYAGNSGDTVVYWVQTAWLLVLALLATGVWSELDRRRDDYTALHKWFRLLVRLALAGQMFYYGLAKIIPTQFPAPSLVTLVEPVGHLSLTDLLWTFIGASTPYQVFTGCAELVGGLLLLTARTTPLGALVCLADMIQVFVLNMTYDFGLKQISFHLILMSAFLLAPDFERLANVTVRGRAATASTDPPLFRNERANRIALVAQLVFGLYLIGMQTRLSLGYWSAEGGGGGPRSALYGIWNVERLVVDGQERPPGENDYDRRWRRIIFDRPSVLAFQRTDDSIAHYGVSTDTTARRLSLTKGSSSTWTASFRFDRPVENRLILDGDMDDHRIHAELQLVEFDSFPLLNSSFRWIRPPDSLGYCLSKTVVVFSSCP